MVHGDYLALRAFYTVSKPSQRILHEKTWSKNANLYTIKNGLDCAWNVRDMMRQALNGARDRRGEIRYSIRATGLYAHLRFARSNSPRRFNNADSSFLDTLSFSLARQLAVVYDPKNCSWIVTSRETAFHKAVPINRYCDYQEAVDRFHGFARATLTLNTPWSSRHIHFSPMCAWLMHDIIAQIVSAFIIFFDRYERNVSAWLIN